MTVNFWIALAVRNSIGGWLMYNVYHHAHWSVFVCLLGWYIIQEIHANTYILNKYNEKAKKELLDSINNSNFDPVIKKGFRDKLNSL